MEKNLFSSDCLKLFGSDLKKQHKSLVDAFELSNTREVIDKSSGKVNKVPVIYNTYYSVVSDDTGIITKAFLIFEYVTYSKDKSGDMVAKWKKVKQAINNTCFIKKHIDGFLSMKSYLTHI